MITIAHDNNRHLLPYNIAVDTALPPACHIVPVYLLYLPLSPLPSPHISQHAHFLSIPLSSFPCVTFAPHYPPSPFAHTSYPHRHHPFFVCCMAPQPPLLFLISAPNFFLLLTPISPPLALRILRKRGEGKETFSFLCLFLAPSKVSRNGDEKPKWEGGGGIVVETREASGAFKPGREKGRGRWKKRVGQKWGSFLLSFPAAVLLFFSPKALHGKKRGKEGKREKAQREKIVVYSPHLLPPPFLPGKRWRRKGV